MTKTTYRTMEFSEKRNTNCSHSKNGICMVYETFVLEGVVFGYCSLCRKLVGEIGIDTGWKLLEGKIINYDK